MNNGDTSKLLEPFLSLNGDFVVMDTETTDLIAGGVYPDIVTLGMIKVFADRTFSNPVEFKIKPTKLMHPLAERVHGISDAEAATFASFSSQWDSIRSWLDGSTVVIHNADFDWPILQDHIDRYRLKGAGAKRVFCSQKNAAVWASAVGVSGSKRGPSLDALTKHFGIDDRRQSLGGVHGAANDAWQTAMVVEAMRNLALS